MSSRSRKKEKLQMQQLQANETASLANSFNGIVIPNKVPHVMSRSSSLTLTQWEGPLPPPELLKQYDEIKPGFAERMLVQYEEQGRHRRDIERNMIDSRDRLMHNGQYYAALLSVFAFIVAGFCAFIEQKEVAIAIAGFDITGVTSAFMYNQYTQREERKQRREEEEQRLSKRKPYKR